MTIWDLSRLRYTVRKITGQFDTTQLPDSSSGQISVNNPPGVDDYINDFYLYDLPEAMRTLKLKNYYQFTTIPNVGTYDVPQNIMQLEPPIYIDGYQFAWYQAPEIFYRIWPELDIIDQAIAVGDGTVGPYTFTLSQTPIQQGTLVIGNQPNIDGLPSPTYETWTDSDTPGAFTNPVFLTSSIAGTTGVAAVDYLSGLCTVTYDQPLPAGVNINAHYHAYVASRPRDILFYQQQLFLRPIPNDTYAVKIVSYVQPTVALAAGGTQTMFDDTSTGQQTLFTEWWQCVAYGAALKILIQEGDHEEYARNKAYFEEAKLLAQRRCLKQLSNQRIQTPYAENVSGPAFPIFPIY
jgi:hypothetical protein